MSINLVHKCLQEIFPQIDARLLKAVALEHPKDADTAAEVVINEIIPMLSDTSINSATPQQDFRPGSSSEGGDEHAVESEEQDGLLRHRNRVREESVGPSSLPPSILDEDAHYSFHSSSSHNDGTGHLSKSLDESTLSNVLDANNDNNKSLRTADSKALYAFRNVEENHDETGFSNISHDVSNKMVAEHLSPPVNATTFTNTDDCGSFNLLHDELRQCDGLLDGNHETVVCAKSQAMEKCDTAILDVEKSMAQLTLCGPGYMPNGDCDHQLDCGSSSVASSENQDVGCSSSKQDFSITENGDVEDYNSDINLGSQSNQLCRTDLLEEIIEETKIDKKTLCTSMESLMNLMKEVEVQEKAAEQAKMEAAMGGSHIWSHVEELKLLLGHAKEANDMHKGEVYGEKAILATEMRELQSRLANLSVERDKSLAVLDEMRQALESRLALAEEMRKKAEQEKPEKEESAKKSLAEQEMIMEKLVQESTRLKQEAEENSKLREFLIDRGHVVDTLQGEISVICQDIRLLKENFDARLPLSKSFTSRWTDCSLSSSVSSARGLVSDSVSELAESCIPKERSSIPSGSDDILSSDSKKTDDYLLPGGNLENGRAKADGWALVDDDWDILA